MSPTPGSFLAFLSAGLGAAMNLKIKVGRGTIRRILKDHLIEPAPSRGRRISWSTFLNVYWRGLAASDFFTVEVWSLKGLLSFYVLFVIDLSTQRVALCGITTNPNEAWMQQMSRNLLDGESGVLSGKRFLIIDRDTKYSSSFRQALEREGVGVIRLPTRSPNLNAYAERFVRSVKDECLSKIIPIGPSMLRRTLREYIEHYHRERNHQSLGNRSISPPPKYRNTTQTIQRKARLGGILNFYQRAALMS
jgi:putative transposase